MSMLAAIRNLSIATRLYAIVGVCLAGLFLIVGFGVGDLYDTVFDGRRAQARTAVLGAESLVAAYAERAAKGEMSREEAQEAAKAAVRALRFGSEYVWINDARQVMVMHPIKPELDGRDMTDFKDPAGTYMFRAFVKTARAAPEGGFVN